MIKITRVEVLFPTGELLDFPTLKAADAVVHRRPANERYQYEVTWEDGTKHMSRSREPSVTEAFESWINNFTFGPVGASESDAETYLSKVRENTPGIFVHLKRLRTELEHS